MRGLLLVPLLFCVAPLACGGPIVAAEDRSTVSSAPVAPAYVPIEFSSKYRKPLEDPSQLTGEVRPQGCAGTYQPAIVGFETHGDAVRLPVWSCFEGCGPGLEYVTAEVHARHSPGFALRCVPVCAANEHRASYVYAGTDCVPGGPEAAEATARQGEQTRQVEAYIATTTLETDSVEAALTASEHLPKPWTLAAARAWSANERALRRLEGVRKDDGVPGSARPDFVAAAMSQTPFGLRQAGRLAKLRVRIERERRGAEKVLEAEEGRERASAEAARRGEEAASRAVHCNESCVGARRRCHEVCVTMTASVCSACDADADRCSAHCEP